MRAVLYVVLGVASAVPAAAADLGELQASYDFLLNSREAGGVLFNFSNEPKFEPGYKRAANALNPPTGNYLLPRSYYDTPTYWGDYVCAGNSTQCAVHDTYNMVDYQLLPASGAGQLQVERVNTHNSANIYDAATWQIAVMLGDVKSKLHIASPMTPYAFAVSLTEVLRQGGALIEGNTAPGAKRATTAGKAFVYNGSVIGEGARAYAFRALAPEWLARDPLMESPHAKFVTAGNLPVSDSNYQAGKISWTDWKPITGENAWAFLIGPLQMAHLHYVVDKKQAFVPFNDAAVRNALDILPTFAAMQSAVGGVYYAPAGTIGNEGAGQINPYEVAVENNFSLYAGLNILRATLQAELAGENNEGKKQITAALTLIDTMINGGPLGPGKQTKGLLSFFKTTAWQNSGFVQGGLANDPSQKSTWIATTDPKAVDVQTWGIAALGTKQIDQWFGSGAAFEMWQNVKTWGAYGVGKTLWGVGYSDKDGNGMDAGGVYKQGVLSAEWTAGAINAVRNMLSYYGTQKDGQKYVAVLKQDEAAMLKGLGTLRIDRYAATDFPGKPADYTKLVSVKTKPYLYASKRYHIPFGWYANPLPSTASTAWVFMIANNYDPFGFGGAPN